MASSMTGFGNGEFQNNGTRITVEARSFNNRYLEVSCRMPPFLSQHEQKVREIVREKLQRGKVYIIDITNNNHREVDFPPNEEVNAPLFTSGSNVYFHTTKDNLYWIDTAAQDVKLSPNPINLTTIK